jgi:tetratricopeptide (TPR) repeat protein
MHCYHSGMSHADDAEAEVTATALALRSIADALDHPCTLERVLAELTQLTARLDLFALRFGVQPHQVAGWSSVRQQAEALLGHPALHRQGDLYFNQDSASVGRVALLQLAGRIDEALAALAKVKPGGGCGNWHATVMMAVHQRRSALYEQAGQLDKALAEQRDAVWCTGLSLYDLGLEVMYTRLGMLLAATGDRKEACKAYQRVVDLHPRTPAAALARHALVELGALIEPTIERVLAVYADQTSNWVERSHGLIALGAHRFPGSYELLIKRLRARRPVTEMVVGRDAWLFDRARLVGALGELGDRRAIPALREFASRESTWRGHVDAAIAQIEEAS